MYTVIDLMRARIELNKSREALLIDQQGLEEAGKDLQNLLGVHEKVEAIDQLDAERILPAVNEAVSTALEQNQQLLQLKMISVSPIFCWENLTQ